MDTMPPYDPVADHKAYMEQLKQEKRTRAIRRWARYGIYCGACAIIGILLGMDIFLGIYLRYN